MVVAIIGIPSCYSIEFNQLELLKDSGSIDSFESSPDNTLITLYWTYLPKGASKQLTLQRTLKYLGPTCISRASHAYLYYDDDRIVWVK